ncbi:hypothetical protein Tco_0773749 [Tanacetum coccineum]|uniref:Uncharacterized protein n=1 Tax=Tanacetum coccineum TaxID=301880 RepID=A0ABQ4ZQK7_9ASTR
MAFPRLQELAAAQNSNSLTDAMSVYIERKINEDLHFAAGLSHLWEVLYSRVNEHSLLIAELNVFGGPLALQCAEFFKQLSQTEVLKMLEIRKSIAENDGLHWLKTENRQLMHYSLNIEDPDHSIITTIPILQRGMTFLKSYGYMDPMQILIQMSLLLYLEGKLFEWRGSLFLVCLDDFGSREFTIDKMTIGCSVWMVRYRVHTDDFMTPLLEGWSIRSNVWRIVLGEREQDSFLVIKLSLKVVQYNLISKTFHEIYDCGSNQVDNNHDDNDDANDDDDEFLQQFQAEHNVYEFILSFASV